MKDKIFDLFGENLNIITFCPICNLRYNPLEVKILEERPDSHLAYIKCRNCDSAVLALIVSNNFGITSLGLITDLAFDDVLRFKSAEVINLDDVIEIHQFLKKEKALINYLN